MTVRNALHVGGNPGPTTAEDARFAQAAVWARNGVAAVQGVVWAGDATLLNATANTGPMQVSVDPFHFVGSKATG